MSTSLKGAGAGAKADFTHETLNMCPSSCSQFLLECPWKRVPGELQSPQQTSVPGLSCCILGGLEFAELPAAMACPWVHEVCLQQAASSNHGPVVYLEVWLGRNSAICTICTQGWWPVLGCISNAQKQYGKTCNACNAPVICFVPMLCSSISP